MTIREAKERDLDAIMALVARSNAAFAGWAGEGWEGPPPEDERPHWQRSLLDPKAWCAVAETSEGIVVGCVSFRAAAGDREGTAHLSRLFVQPDAWRSGTGTALLGAAKREMRERGFRRATLFVALANSPARAFYENDGWRPGAESSEWRGLPLIEYAIDLGG